MWSAAGVRHKNWWFDYQTVTQVQLHIKALLMKED